MSPITGKEILSLKDIKTNEELREYLESPHLLDSFPTEHDGRHLVARVSSQDPTTRKMNWCRSLDHVQVIRATCRNHGSLGMKGVLEHGTDEVPIVLLGLPGPAELFQKLWEKVPEFIRAKLTNWAKSKMEGPIAFEIRDYVKQVLHKLPIPIPDFFLNSVANIAIPPLVTFIIKTFGPKSESDSTLPALSDEPIFVHHTSTSLELMKSYDRKILLAAGLQPHELPAHLSPGPLSASDDPVINVSSQPDDRDCRTGLAQFYQQDSPNGHKPLDLAEFVEAQIRFNKDSDPEPMAFGMAVWDGLDADTKTKIQTAAKANPPDRVAIGDLLYTPTRNRLGDSPYSVPSVIVDTFTTMKAPEVIEWVIKTQK